jgi:hypothetical protein
LQTRDRTVTVDYKGSMERNKGEKIVIGEWAETVLSGNE